MNKIYIVHFDIPYEFGEIISVHSSLKEAFKEICEYYRKQHTTSDPEDWTIQEWYVDGDFIQTFELELLEDDEFQLRKIVNNERSTFLTKEYIDEMPDM